MNRYKLVPDNGILNTANQENMQGGQFTFTSTAPYGAVGVPTPTLTGPFIRINAPVKTETPIMASIVDPALGENFPFAQNVIDTSTVTQLSPFGMTAMRTKNGAALVNGPNGLSLRVPGGMKFDPQSPDSFSPPLTIDGINFRTADSVNMPYGLGMPTMGTGMMQGMMSGSIPGMMPGLMSECLQVLLSEWYTLV